MKYSYLILYETPASTFDYEANKHFYWVLKIRRKPKEITERTAIRGTLIGTNCEVYKSAVNHRVGFYIHTFSCRFYDTLQNLFAEELFNLV